MREACFISVPVTVGQLEKIWDQISYGIWMRAVYILEISLLFKLYRVQ